MTGIAPRDRSALVNRLGNTRSQWPRIRSEGDPVLVRALLHSDQVFNEEEAGFEPATLTMARC